MSVAARQSEYDAAVSQVEAERAELRKIEPGLIDELVNYAVGAAKVQVESAVTQKTEVTTELANEARLSDMKRELGDLMAAAPDAVRAELDKSSLWLQRVEEPERRDVSWSGGRYAIHVSGQGNDYYSAPSEITQAFEAALAAMVKLLVRYGYREQSRGRSGALIQNWRLDRPTARSLMVYADAQERLRGSWEKCLEARQRLEEAKASALWDEA